MSLYLEDFSREELAAYAAAAYGPEKFDDPAVAPLHTLEGDVHCLELWHGPTSAFKDMALQMLPHLLSASLKKTGEHKTACILVATSGDTGKAALEGFRDVDQTKILVFIPRTACPPCRNCRWSPRRAATWACAPSSAISMTPQTGVKRIFSDEAIRDTLAQRGYFLSSANSINWGRVLPQIVYYVSLYCDLLHQGKINQGERVNVCVPTGNFGNILAAYYAKCMGVPLGTLICASNCNDVLTEFLWTGVYNRNRVFHTTMSPSMDILISSNLERLLFALSGGDDAQVRSYMEQLAAEGKYRVGGEILKKLQDLFWAGSCGEAETLTTIHRYFEEQNYLIDTPRPWRPMCSPSTGRKRATCARRCSLPRPAPISSAAMSWRPSAKSRGARAWSCWSSCTKRPA